MKIFDCHSHYSTRKGLHHASQEEYENAQRIFKRKREFQSEEEMAEAFRSRGVRSMLDIYKTARLTDPDEIRAANDYTIQFAKDYPDIVHGNWLAINPLLKDFWIKEYERVNAGHPGMISFCISQTPNGHPPSDPVWDPFYKIAIDNKVPFLIMVGLTGIGQGFPGGNGVLLEHGHPMHIDRVAAKFPELKILAGRPAWPWQDDMLAVMLHKGNIMYEVHGWSPKYFTPALKKEIGGRLQDRILFGWDWPTLTLERLVDDWKGLGYSGEVYEKVFHANAERFFS